MPKQIAMNGHGMETMTTHQRMTQVYQHREPDRVPITDGPWESTLARWRREGLPEGVRWDRYFDVDRFATIGVDTSPRFETAVIEETDTYIMIKGTASVHSPKDDKILGRVTAGQTFGEIAFFTLEPRSASVRALEPCEIFVLKSNQLHYLGLQYPVIFSEMARALGVRLARR